MVYKNETKFYNLMTLIQNWRYMLANIYARALLQVPKDPSEQGKMGCEEKVYEIQGRRCILSRPAHKDPDLLRTDSETAL